MGSGVTDFYGMWKFVSVFNGPCFEPDKYSSHSYTLFLKGLFQYYPPTYAFVFLAVLLLSFSNSITWIEHSEPSAYFMYHHVWL
jgi:hypothetical protein